MPKSRTTRKQEYQPLSRQTGRWLAASWTRAGAAISRFWGDLTLARGMRYYRALAIFCVICLVTGVAASAVWRSTAMRDAVTRYRAVFLGDTGIGGRPNIPGVDGPGTADPVETASGGDPVTPAEPAKPTTGDQPPVADPDPVKPAQGTTPPAEQPAGPSVPPARPRPDLSTMGRPVTGPVITEFGWQFSATMADWRFHPGVDLQAADNTTVRAALAGNVLRVDDSYDLGIHCVIDHGGGVHTVYGSLKTCSVQAGQAVTKGQAIGTVGTSAATGGTLGPHLHFELQDGGEAQDPVPYWP